MSPIEAPRTQSFSTRAELPTTPPLTSYLLHLISIKRSNLCVSADVESTNELLRLAEEVGEHICVLKTHADIIRDFSDRTIRGLQEIAQRKKFLLFEDRKFGDIGNTVQTQYARGTHRIATWAHITNAHLFPGPALIPALQTAAAQTLSTLSRSVSTSITTGTPRLSISSVSAYNASSSSSSASSDEEDLPHPRSETRSPSIVTATTTISQTFELSYRPLHSLARSVSAGEGEDGDREEALLALGEPPLARGLLLLAEMSSEGNLLTLAYTQACLDAAREHSDFVLGFISQKSLNEPGEGDAFLCFTPGVVLPPEEEEEEEEAGAGKGDGLGQRYRTPRVVILGEGVDVIIVGRGILGADDRGLEAERYRRAAWAAYEERVSK